MKIWTLSVAAVVASVISSLPVKAYDGPLFSDPVAQPAVAEAPAGTRPEAVPSEAASPEPTSSDALIGLGPARPMFNPGPAQPMFSDPEPERHTAAAAPAAYDLGSAEPASAPAAEPTVETGAADIPVALEPAYEGEASEPLFAPPPPELVLPAGLVITQLPDEPGGGDEASAAPVPSGPQMPAEPGRLPQDPAYAPPGGAAPPNPFIEENGPPRGTVPGAIAYPGSYGACGPAACGPAGGSPGGRCAPAHQPDCGSTCGSSSKSCLPDWCGCATCETEPCHLFECCTADKLGIQIGGWVDQGVSVVANSPSDRYTGVVTFNDRDGEYQMNQLWFYLNKPVDPDACGLQVGGRIDFVYGTDARFTQAVDGLEANWNQQERFYQAAVPQFYVDVAFSGWTVRMGHFYTILGYEVVQAPDNFFYSHAYTMQYGEPFTHLGLLATRDIGPFTLSAGFQRGNDQFDDTDGLNALGFLGGVSWTGFQDFFTLAFAISANEDGPDFDTTIWSIVGTANLTEKLTWVVQHDYGIANGPRLDAQWYGVNNYLLYELSRCLAAGLRVEWFRDDDGVRVTGLGDGNRNQGPFVGNFYEITAGINWKPHPNILVRPEARWDWFDLDEPGGRQPYDAGRANDQFLWGCDLVVTF